MDDQNIMELVESSDEESPSLSKLMSVEDMLLGKGRQEKSLGNLATKFADLLRNSPDGVMHLNKVINLLFIYVFYFYMIKNVNNKKNNYKIIRL